MWLRRYNAMNKKVLGVICGVLLGMLITAGVYCYSSLSKPTADTRPACCQGK